MDHKILLEKAKVVLERKKTLLKKYENSPRPMNSHVILNLKLSIHRMEMVVDELKGNLLLERDGYE